MKTIKINDWGEIPGNFTGIVEFLNRTNKWYSKHWFEEGFIHREDGPAIEYADGEKHWIKKGKRHRTDGPAVICLNGTKEWWYIDDVWYETSKLKSLIQTSIYLGKQKGNHNLYWLRFLTDKGIEEFPIVPGMEQGKEFIPLFNKVFEATKP